LAEGSWRASEAEDINSERYESRRLGQVSDAEII